MKKDRDNFSSNLGAIMAAVGSAVGLGNIWRFSYITGINGGGAFLLTYLICVVLIGVSVMIAELSIGRKTKLSPVSAFLSVAPKTPWWITGLLATLAPFLILLYYPVVSGWAIGYIKLSIFNWSEIKSDSAQVFTDFTAGTSSIVFSIIALLLTTGVLLFGVSKGIERISKVLLPLLGVALIILVIRALTLPNAFDGLKFLFYPDFSKITMTSFLDALGHSFYSLSLGMGIIITYASYMKKEDNLIKTSLSIISLDTIIAVLAGMAIFPAVFSFGLEPTQGAGLAFITLPSAFAMMPLGQLFSIIFFFLLFIAALTSMISIMQVPVAFLEDQFKLKKKTSLISVGIVSVILGLPAALSFSSLADFKIFGLTYFDFLDRVANNFILPITALLTILFIIFKFGINESIKEFLIGSNKEKSILTSMYKVAIVSIAPIAIILIMLHSIGLF